jgi:DNA-binding IclR family transcriptional regulator
MRSELEAPDGPRAMVNALAHGLAILQMFTDEQQVIGVSQIGRQIGVHRSNASRLAATLHAMGFLAQAGEPGQYRLGPQLIRLGQLAGRNNDLAQQALGPLRQLVEKTGETGHIGILDGSDALTIAVVDGWQTVRMHSHVNKRSPAYRTSIGKSVLSGLDDAAVRQLFQGHRLVAATPNSITSIAGLLRELALVRARGYAIDNEELELGLRCVAAPIWDAGGEVVASLGLSGPAPRLTDAVVAELAVLVTQAAAQASAAIGGVSPHARPAAVAGPARGAVPRQAATARRLSRGRR